MKIRKGFVSNSSSSSFICDISGQCESGMDLDIEDAGMYICEVEHTFNEEYVIDEDNTLEKYEDIEGRYELPEKYCPICSFKKITSADLTKYLLKKSSLTTETCKENIFDEFKNYKELMEFIK